MSPPEFEYQPLKNKVVQLHRLFEESRVGYGFGGALALSYFSEPRATSDIDVNVFVDAVDRDAAITSLAELAGINAEQLAEFRKRVEASDQGELSWGGTRVDLFFSGTDFHDSMSKRIRTVDFGGQSVKIISAEDLVVCKALFDRPKDWLDIESVVEYRGENVDLPYILKWLQYFLSDDDARHQRVKELFGSSG